MSRLLLLQSRVSYCHQQYVGTLRPLQIVGLSSPWLSMSRVRKIITHLTLWTSSRRGIEISNNLNDKRYSRRVPHCTIAISRKKKTIVSSSKIKIKRRAFQYFPSARLLFRRRNKRRPPQRTRNYRNKRTRWNFRQTKMAGFQRNTRNKSKYSLTPVAMLIHSLDTLKIYKDLLQ